MFYQPHQDSSMPASSTLGGGTRQATHSNPSPAIPTAPHVNRASMLARPWKRCNPLGRWLHRKDEPDEVPDNNRSVPVVTLHEWQRDGRARRAVLLALIFLPTGVASAYLGSILSTHGGALLERLILVLFLVLFCWVSAGFWTAIAGFLVLQQGGDRHRVTRAIDVQEPPVEVNGTNRARTAIVMPICNEDVARVFAGLRATYESLATVEHARHFDFYILSDSSDTDICTAELDAWLTLCRTVKGFGNIFYRRRKRRIKRKNGNIADFCKRWGKNYRYMVVLDADSVMSGKCLSALVDMMEADPAAGIIQTAPRMAGRDTLYARIQQFATRVYGPLYTAGLHYWQLGESHYWGHNAIIRIAPFMSHCALAPLPGKGALSGEILSHDFIEAALMRRAGWTVWIAYDLAGSYEEVPPNLLDELQRDRRWCYGNMMNFRLILERGIHPVYRAVFATGLMAYLSSLLWLVFLTLSTLLLATLDLNPARHASAPLSSAWPLLHSEHALQLFGLTTILLILPKLLGVAHICLQDATQFGGNVRLVFSMLLELVFAMFVSPIKMLFHAGFVIAALWSCSLHWKSPSRSNAETSWSDAVSLHSAHTLLGLAWGTGVYLLSPVCLIWLFPVVGALALSIPLSVLSSRVSAGNVLRKMQLFLTPEETLPPEELRAASTYYNDASKPPGFVEAVVDPATNALVRACGKKCGYVPSSTKAARFNLLQRALHKGPDGLSSPEKCRLLNDPLTLFQLHIGVWESSVAHPQWRDLADRRESEERWRGVA
jgi:membrane glycosyltransferase